MKGLRAGSNGAPAAWCGRGLGGVKLLEVDQRVARAKAACLGSVYVVLLKGYQMPRIANKSPIYGQRTDERHLLLTHHRP
jgi:methylaspartate ammonia-lyase